MMTFRMLLLFVCTVIFVSPAYANSCETLLCMAGKLQGQDGGGDCSGPISDYFSIVKFKKRGKFDPGQTASARLSFLTSCAAPGVGDWPVRINAVYGTIRSLGF